MCDMHRLHLLYIPMGSESVSIWNTLSFLGVEVLVGIAITGKKLMGGIVIDGFLIIKSFTQAPIFNFLVLNLSLLLLAYTSYFSLFFLPILFYYHNLVEKGYEVLVGIILESLHLSLLN